MSKRVKFEILLPGMNEVEEVIFGANRLSMVNGLSKAEPGRLQLLTVSNTPAWIYSVNGERLQAALPKQKGVKITLSSYKKDYCELDIQSENNKGTSIVCTLSDKASEKSNI